MTVHPFPRRLRTDPAYDAGHPAEISRIGATLIGLAREGLPAPEARRRLLACGMSETGADALIESAKRNLTRTA